MWAHDEIRLRCDQRCFPRRLFLPFSGCLAPQDEDSTTFRLATTTSMRDSGLLDLLIEEFETMYEVDVNTWRSARGSLQLGRSGDVDALIVHARNKK